MSTRGRGLLPSALTTARWLVGSGSCLRVTLVREQGGSTVGSPITVNSRSRPWDTPTTERTTWLGPRILGGGAATCQPEGLSLKIGSPLQPVEAGPICGEEVCSEKAVGPTQVTN